MALKPDMPRAWQRMLSGRRLDLLDPSPLDIEIEDIAHGLARVARWNGQTLGEHPFSVAQHSLIVEMILKHTYPDMTASSLLPALLHDGAEYVIGDMISPFKSAIGQDYKRIEERLEAAIHIRFGLSPRLSSQLKRKIKQADRISAYFEAIHLAGFAQEEALQLFGAPNGAETLPLPIKPWSTQQAQDAFLERFHQLFAQLDA
ncbi:HD family hydrolase [uncultured Cohaesibacter sp.]|uniref:HD family hydrolase n=1 Tax=uncultured Cohaesibacter sp. TaxID=1002546 RepID=UPI00292D1956|nr:HD family hydrolase [uncultured Cohaesibacter sp.]